MYRTYKVPEGTKQVMAALMISWIAEQKAPHFCWPAYKNPEQQRAIAICELMDKHTARINELLESGNMHAISHSDGLPTNSISADTMLYVGEAQQYLATMGYELEFEPWQDAGDGKADQAEASPVEDANSHAGSGTTRRWTEAFTAEVQAHRDKHGPTATARHYGVSVSLITKKTQPKTKAPRPGNHWRGLLR